MSRNTFLLRLLAAVGAIAAIALAAATLDSPLETGGGGGGTGDGAGEGPPDPQQPVDHSAGDPGELPVLLEYLVLAAVAVVAIGLVWYLLANRREAVKAIAAVLAIVLVLAAIVAFVFDGQAPEPQPIEQVEQVNDSSGDNGAAGSGESDSFSMGPLLFGLTLLTAIFIGGLLVSRGKSAVSTTEASPPDEDVADRTDAAAVGSAAGRAADRIDHESEADVDNEIYRAWREMTDPLDVDRPETSTPREFATSAVDAGMAREDVDELTRLFEDVRYGDVETTDEMEGRAVDVLRRIESTYADGTDDAGGAGGANGAGGPGGPGGPGGDDVSATSDATGAGDNDANGGGPR